MMTGKDGVLWAIEFFRKRGVSVQPSEEGNMLVLWEQHIKELANAEKEVKPKQKLESNDKFQKGFITGQE